MAWPVALDGVFDELVPLKGLTFVASDTQVFGFRISCIYIATYFIMSFDAALEHGGFIRLKLF